MLEFVPEFLQEHLSAGLAPAALKVCVAAISVSQISLEGASFGRPDG